MLFELETFSLDSGEVQRGRLKSGGAPYDRAFLTGFSNSDLPLVSRASIFVAWRRSCCRRFMATLRACCARSWGEEARRFSLARAFLIARERTGGSTFAEDCSMRISRINSPARLLRGLSTLVARSKTRRLGIG